MDENSDRIPAMSDRGVSAIVGLLLIIGLTLIAIVTILAIGGAALQSAQDDAHLSQMENSMSQMASKASLVALGESHHQEFSLGQLGTGAVTVDPTAGNLRMWAEDESNEWQYDIIDKPLGAFVYSNGETQIAYQGGGVWKNHSTGSEMLSPPEYHYQYRTLTFPVIRVSGSPSWNQSSAGTITRSADDGTPVFPQESNETLSNPVEEEHVFVEIESEYHWAWTDFFESRTTGEVNHTPEEQRVVVDLTVPFEAQFNAPVTATGTNPGIDIRGGAEADDWQEGVEYDSVSARIESDIEDCEENDCNEPSDENGERVFSNAEETYFIDNDVRLQDDGNWVFDTSDGDIRVLVDGSVDVDNQQITVNGENDVTVLLRDGFAMDAGTVSTDTGEASQFILAVHSDADPVDGYDSVIELRGSSQFTGVIYAPESSAEVRGGTEFYGSMIVESITDRGGASTSIEYDENLAGEELDIANPPDSIKFLHVTDNEIEIDIRSR